MANRRRNRGTIVSKKPDIHKKHQFSHKRNIDQIKMSDKRMGNPENTLE